MSAPAPEARSPRGRTGRLRRWGPFAVSALILAALLARLDLRAALAAFDGRAVVVLLLALAVYIAVTLGLEALSLVRLAPAGGTRLPVATAARIRAASYLVAVIHYALGIAAVSILLKRRAGIAVSVAAGMALLLTALDMGVMLGCVTLALLAGDEVPGVRASVVALGGAGLLGGFLVARGPGRFALLERLRASALLRAVATTPLGLLAQVALLRVVFVASFFGLVGAALWGFGVVVPLGDLVIGVAIVALVAALPIAASGLGTGQAAFVWVFRDHGEPEVLLACSLALSAGLIALRALLGAAFAREYAREAVAVAPQGEAG